MYLIGRRIRRPDAADTLRIAKALQIGLKPVVVVNKVDKPNCRPEEVYEMVFDLMFSLNATEDQLDFPVIYGSAKIIG